jgi:hypothetical protein
MEVLYSNRIPITIKVGDYKIYELYEKLPIVILDSVNQLSNFKLLNEKYEVEKNKKFDLKILKTDFWLKKIENNV